jgi:hypothetical protein
MRNFFHALEQFRVRYLLISGQATVLYGASTFSEDIDLWVDLSGRNWQRALEALEACSARVYKLTPPLERQYAARGHGFHFTVPDEELPHLTTYLDIMGAPPRVESFASCFPRARIFDTDWGRLPVIHPRDLVLVKRTQRLSDYAVISALVRIECQEVRSRQQWEWGLQNTFEAQDLLTLYRRGKPEWQKKVRCQRPAVQLLLRRRRTSAVLRDLSTALALEMEETRQADRDYWRPIIAELRELGRQHRLLKAGTPVAVARRRGKS